MGKVNSSGREVFYTRFSHLFQNARVTAKAEDKRLIQVNHLVDKSQRLQDRQVLMSYSKHGFILRMIETMARSETGFNSQSTSNWSCSACNGANWWMVNFKRA